MFNLDKFIADSVTVKYECPNCGHINENTLTKEIKSKLHG